MYFVDNFTIKINCEGNEMRRKKAGSNSENIPTEGLTHVQRVLKERNIKPLENLEDLSGNGFESAIFVGTCIASKFSPRILNGLNKLSPRTESKI
jgi:hypothetical protein